MSQGPIEYHTPATPSRQANLWPLVFAALPLGCWPFLLVPNVMSLAGEQRLAATSPFVTVVSKAFLWGSTAYPLVYIAALVISLVLALAADRPAAASGVAWAPLAYTVAVLACFCAWIVAT